MEIPCKYCNSPRGWPGTGMCDSCWELHHRIRHRPDIARRILVELEKTQAGEYHIETGNKVPASSN